MGREPVIRKIGDLEYRVSPFPASQGYRLLVALSKLLGAPLARAAGAVDQDAEVGKGALALLQGVNFEQLGGALQQLADRIDEEAVWSLTHRMLDGCEVRKDAALARAMGGEDARPSEGGWLPVDAVFDMIFTANYGPLFLLLGLVLEVNYKLPLPVFLGSGAATQAKG